MEDQIANLRTAGFSDDEIGAWTVQKRGELTAAGFKDNEIDAYFVGGVTVSDDVPDAMIRRVDAGEEARKREGGLMQTIPQFTHLMGTTEGRTRLWDAVKKYPAQFVEGMADMFKLPGEVEKGNIDINSPEGLDQAIGLGMLVAGSRLNKLSVTGKTSGLSVALGEPVSRISRGPMGEITDIPIGTTPTSVDFVAAARAVGGDAKMATQEKLLKLYDERGAHPAEIAHDAANDPVIAQRILSSDAMDVPNGYAAPRRPQEPPPPPKPPKAPEPPEPGSFEAAQKAVLDKVSVGDRDTRSMSWSKLYAEAIDDLHPIKGVSEDAYQIARLTRGQFGKAEHFLEQGTFDFNTYKTTGKPLKEVLAPVRDDLEGLRAYMTAKRAIEIEGSGRKSGIDTAAAQQVVEAGEGKYAKAAQDAVTYQNSVIKYLKDSGVLSDKAFDAMVEAGKNYVPFYRVFGADEGGPGAGKSFGPGNPLKKLKGSERGIVDPLESIIKNTYAYISIAERNAAGVKIIETLQEQGFKTETKAPKYTGAEADLVDYLKQNGVHDAENLVDFVKATAGDDGTAISAWKDGKRVSVEVNDPDLVQAFRGLDQQSAGMLTRIFAVPARTLRAGAVLTPDFMARNLLRDFMTAFVNSKGIFSPIDSFKGLKSAIAKDDTYSNWVKSGGANATMVALDRRYMQESLTKLTADTGLGTRAWNVVTNPLAGLRMTSELIENATRLGEFKKALGGATDKAAMQSAAYASREVTLDFARIGARMRGYNMVTAFANAQIQGMDRIGRAFKDRPVNSMVKIAAGITLPSVLLWWSNHGDPRYEELPNWQKDLFWIVLTDDWQPISAVDAQNKPEHLLRRGRGGWEVNNGHIWRIPKPFELGVVFGSGVERALSATVGADKEAFEGFSKSVMSMVAPNIVPTAVQPVFEQWANRSSFTDRTLIPADVEKQLPEYQYTPYTTELAKTLGRLFSAFPGMREAAVEPGAVAGPAARSLTTPILIENYIRSWTGGLGMYALQAADAGLRKAGMLPDPVTPTPTLADIPFVRAFAVRYPSATTQSIQDFYDDYSRDKRYFDSWMAKAKEGDAEAMEKMQAAGGPRMFLRLDAIKEVLSQHSKLIRDIYKNPEMPADEKRQFIDSLYYSMIEIGKSGKEALRSIPK